MKHRYYCLSTRALFSVEWLSAVSKWRSAVAGEAQLIYVGQPLVSLKAEEGLDPNVLSLFFFSPTRTVVYLLAKLQ